MRFTRRSCTAALVAWLCASAPCAQDRGADVADIPSKEIELALQKKDAPEAKDAPAQTYFLIGPRKGARKPAKGHALLIVLPGGDGSREFHPFIKRIVKHALGPDFIAAQPVAPTHAMAAQVVWPTARTPGLHGAPATEDFVEVVIADAAARLPIDRTRVYVMAWSSSGPAAYAISLRKEKSVTGFFISMSVFQPMGLPPLDEAKGEAYVIEHSPDDKVCPFAMAKDAEQRLAAAGAKVKFVQTSGDHGWSGDVYGRMRAGIAWLEKNRSAPVAGEGRKEAAGKKK